MSDAFDLSEECKKTIDNLLKDHATFESEIILTREAQLDLDRRSREGVIYAISRGLKDFKSRNFTKATIWTTLDARFKVLSADHAEALFRGIANAICKGNAKHFHPIGVAGRFSFSWQYAHYDFKVFTREDFFRTFYITVIDTNKVQPDEDDSGYDTEAEENEPQFLASTLQKLQSNLNRLEASIYLPPIASPQRLE